MRPDELLLQGLDALPLEQVLRAFRWWPLRSCPSATCRADYERWCRELELQWLPTASLLGNGWTCSNCGRGTGPAAFVAALLWDLDRDQVDELLEFAP